MPHPKPPLPHERPGPLPWRRLARVATVLALGLPALAQANEAWSSLAWAGDAVLLLVVAAAAFALWRLRQRLATERLNALMVNHSLQLIGILDDCGRLVQLNAAGRSWFAAERHPDDPLWTQAGWNLGDQPSRLRQTFERARQGRQARLDVRIEHLGQPARLGELCISPLKDAQAPAMLLLEVRDVTARRQIEDKLMLAAAVFEQAREGIMITDPRGVVLSVNQAFSDITGYDASELQGQYPAMLTTALDNPMLHREMRRHLLRNGHWQGELCSLRKNGRAYTALVSLTRHTDARGRTLHLIGIVNDITRTREAEQEMLRHAHYDSLTGLPNRLLLVEHAVSALAMARRNQEPMALLFMDLNRFRDINDNFSHTAGDAVLAEMAQRLRHGLRDADTIARLGGDEFAVLLPSTDAEGAARVAGKLLDQMGTPFSVMGHELSLTMSIGIAMFPTDGGDVDALVRSADTAMYRAKQEGPGHFCFFAEGMQQRSVRQLQLESALRRAVEREELLLHYQPQLAVDTGEVCGVEALVRWRHPELGMVSPGEFIPLAESSGQILAIGEWVMRTAVHQVKAWEAAGLPPVVMAVNLSAVQFRDPTLPERVKAILDQADLPPKYLELELTESVATGNPAAAMAMMERLHALGVRLSIDDFGTGYSSLNYLKRFPIHTLKIDQSFVRDIGNDDDDRAIVQAIIQMARALHLSTVAEGVENDEQARFLRANGCDTVQGYRYCRPVDADAALAWMMARMPSAQAEDATRATA